MKLRMKIACEIPKALIWKTRTSHSLPLFHLNTHCDDSDAALRMESCGKRSSQGRCSHSHREKHESETSGAHLLKNLSTCSRPQTSSISRLFQSVTESTDQLRDETQKTAQVATRRWGRGAGWEGWRDWRNRSIFLNVTCSLFEAWWRKWANVGKWGAIAGRGGGRRRGENVWHTGGRVSMWVIGRCRGGEGTKQGQRKKR